MRRKRTIYLRRSLILASGLLLLMAALFQPVARPAFAQSPGTPQAPVNQEARKSVSDLFDILRSPPAQPPAQSPADSTDTDTAPNNNTSPAPAPTNTNATPANAPTTNAANNQPSPFATGANIAVIPIGGAISPATQRRLVYRVNKAEEMGADLIILELDTPGGRLDTALDMSRYIKSKMPAPTIAWVNDHALSAGILIASSTTDIIMATGSQTGDCAPILLFGQLGPVEREKAVAPLLAEFRSNAQTNNHPYVLLAATAELGVRAYKVRHKRTGEVAIVNEADYRIMVHGDAHDIEILNKPTDFNFTDDQVRIRPVSPRRATAADKNDWTLVERVHDGSSLLTMSDVEAVNATLALTTGMDKLADVEKYFQAASIVRIESTWSEVMVTFLMSPLGAGLLVLLGLLGLLWEAMAPGLGIGTGLAVVAFGLLFGAPLLAGLAEWWPLALFVIGLGLVLAEIFITPGIGVLGITGGVLICAGLILQPVLAGGTGFSADRLQSSVLWMGGALMLSLLVAGLMIHYIGRLPAGNNILLRSMERAGLALGPVAPAGGMSEHVSGDETIGFGDLAVGETGTVLSHLRPIGRAEFDGQSVDVVSTSNWIEPGETVRITEVHGNRIVVERIET